MKNLIAFLFSILIEVFKKSWGGFNKVMFKPVEIEAPEPLIEVKTEPVVTTTLIPSPKKVYTGWMECAIKKDFPTSQYVQEKTTKRQIVLHHTVGGSAQSSINTWIEDPQRVCTHFIIDRDGTIYQLFSLDYWGYHLYVASPGNRIDAEFKKDASRYDKHSIGIELCNFGPISVRNNRYYNIYNKRIDEDDVVKIDFRGYQYWEKYDPRQIESLRKLLIELIEVCNLKDSLLDDYSLIFNINRNALKMRDGIYSHVSYRSEKFDCYPSPLLLDMLNNLKRI